MIGVAELTWRILAVGAIAMLSMAFRTSRIGVVAGRDSFIWLLYGLVFPGISLAHAHLLLTRTRRRGPLRKAEISIIPPSPLSTLRRPTGPGDQRLNFELYDPRERRQVNLGGTVTEVRRDPSGVVVLTCELIGPVWARLLGPGVELAVEVRHARSEARIERVEEAMTAREHN